VGVDQHPGVLAAYVRLAELLADTQRAGPRVRGRVGVSSDERVLAEYVVEPGCGGNIGVDDDFHVVWHHDGEEEKKRSWPTP